jgi:hypothetical protein
VSGLLRAWDKLALTGVLATAAVILWTEAGDSSFVRDDWSMILYRRGASLDSFLYPHNDQVAVLPAFFWRGLTEIFGIDSYAPFLVGLIAANLVCGVLLYVYVSRRLGPVVGLAATTVIVLLGPAWEVLLWPFEVSFVASAAFGLAALLALDRNDRRGDWAAAAFILLSIASSNAGLPFAAAAGAQIVATRAEWLPRLARVLAVPLALFAVWYAVYRDRIEAAHEAQPEQPETLHLIEEAPRWAFDMFAAGLGGLSGLPPGAHAALGTLALVALAVRLLRPQPLGAAAWPALALAATYFGGTALARYQIQEPDTSRYIFVSAIAIVLAGASLLRPPAADRRVHVVILAIAGGIVLTNLADLRNARAIEDESRQIRTGLAMIELVRERVDPSFQPAPDVAAEIRAGPYFGATDDWGSPAYSVSEVTRLPEQLRQRADGVLANALRLSFAPPRPGLASGPPPAVAPRDATTRGRAGCVEVKPSAAGSSVDLDLGSGIVVEATGGQVELRARRFADGYARDAVASLPPNGEGTFAAPPDGAPGAWRVQLTSDAPFAVC